jgi:hypothetical protein
MESTLQYHWQQLNLAQLPPPLRGYSLVFDKKHRQAVLVAAGDTWIWNGTAWSEVQSQPAPPARNTTHLVYDSITECVLLFGGIGVDGTPLNDVWLWNGTMWTEQRPTQFPSAVGGAAFACHKQQGILFGGIASPDSPTGSHRVGTFSDETWLWNGTTWTELQTSNPPPARTGGQLVYDPARQQTLLFGGYNSTGYLNDMWLWNGANWSQLHPATLPPTQTSYRAVFHEQLQQVLLLAEVTGGTNSLQHSYQIWLWNGTNWLQNGTNALLPGSIEGLTYDGARNTLITCVVTGGKAPLGNKSTSTTLPNLAAPTLASQTWVWA